MNNASHTFFGDSLTAGHGLPSPAEESMPALIQREINAGSLKCEVINCRTQWRYNSRRVEDVAGIAHLNLRDGIHASAAGYKIIADKVWPVLKPLMEQQV